MSKINVKKEYSAWCKKIAGESGKEELINHFKEHVCEHFNRHNGEGEIGFYCWLTSVFNFMNILKEKYKVDNKDMLLAFCIYLKEHKKGPIPAFNVDEFIKEHKSELKDYYCRPKRLKKWNKEKVV